MKNLRVFVLKMALYYRKLFDKLILKNTSLRFSNKEKNEFFFFNSGILFSLKKIKDEGNTF
jgi:hypothetical protein